MLDATFATLIERARALPSAAELHAAYTAQPGVAACLDASAHLARESRVRAAMALVRVEQTSPAGGGGVGGLFGGGGGGGGGERRRREGGPHLEALGLSFGLAAGSGLASRRPDWEGSPLTGPPLLAGGGEGGSDGDDPLAQTMPSGGLEALRRAAAPSPSADDIDVATVAEVQRITGAAEEVARRAVRASEGLV